MSRRNIQPSDLPSSVVSVSSAFTANQLAVASNADRAITFGSPQNDPPQTATIGTPLNFGTMNPAPAARASASKGIDIIGHWYNDFGLWHDGSGNGGWVGWYDWAWNSPSNTRPSIQITAINGSSALVTTGTAVTSVTFASVPLAISAGNKLAITNGTTVLYLPGASAASVSGSSVTVTVTSTNATDNFTPGAGTTGYDFTNWQTYDPQRQPIQGFYQGDDPNVLDWQCYWMAEAGVNVVSLVSTSGITSTDLTTSTPTAANYWMYQLFNECPNFAALQWMLWLPEVGGSITTQADVVAGCTNVVNAYSQFSGGYIKTENGKRYPVVFLWDIESWRGLYDSYSGNTNTSAQLIALSQQFQAIGYDGVMVLARNANSWYEVYPDSSLPGNGVILLTADYNQDYSAGGSSYADYVNQVAFPTLPDRVLAINTSEFSQAPHPSGFTRSGTTPALFGEVLNKAVDHILSAGLRRMLTIYNVSEWAEGGPGLLPNLHDSFGYLDQIRALPVISEPVERRSSYGRLLAESSYHPSTTSNFVVSGTNAQSYNAAISLSFVAPDSGSVDFELNGVGAVSQFVLNTSGSPTGGTFTLICNGQQTSAINYSTTLTPATIQTAIQALPGLSGASVGGTNGGPFYVTLLGVSGTSVSSVVTQQSLTTVPSLTGGTSSTITATEVFVSWLPIDPNTFALSFSGSPTGGTFTLTINGTAVTPITYSTSLGWPNIQAAIQATSGLSSVTCTGGTPGGTIYITIPTTSPTCTVTNALTGGTSPNASIALSNPTNSSVVALWGPRPQRITTRTIITGLKPKQTYTWRWGANSLAGGTTYLMTGPSYPAVMRVYAL